ncbi:MAG: 50S ribosomal protein L17 [Puniceicoccales bacterium]|jgi:large subunit ribosomal protein L17|nr:50S ribosomal protein L17 [Puniceicoccales bacterium]
MRHRKHSFQLGVKKEHRASLMAGLSAALLRHKRIQTTLAKAKALRPYAEKVITLACKASRSDVPEQSLHYRRMAVARVRDQEAVKTLFDELAKEFINRPGGYTRIYKLVPRQGDAAQIALIELVMGDDKGHGKRSRRHRAAAKAHKQASKPEGLPGVL